MKKKISLALLVILAAFTLIGCGKQMTDAEKFVGTWESPPNQCEGYAETDPINWGEKMVVFSDGTAYASDFLASDPDTIVAEYYWDKWTMESGYLKHESGGKEGVLFYEFIDDNTIAFRSRYNDEVTYAYKTK